MTMPTRFLEDFEIGESWESAPTPLSAEEIVDFGLKYDPQPMHTDAALAAASPFKGLVASGWQVAALSMRLFIQAGGHGGTPVVGLGIDELRWLAPVRAGDVLTVRREVVDVRRSASDPRHGIVRTRVSVRKQDGTTAMTLVSAGRVPARPRAAEAAP
jgi:acyl dehydratase